jgi:alpha-amylase
MGADEPTPENYTLLQGFEWNVPADGKHYNRLHDAMPAYKHIGISNVWLPPGCKASSPNVSPFYPATSSKLSLAY